MWRLKDLFWLKSWSCSTDEEQPSADLFTHWDNNELKYLDGGGWLLDRLEEGWRKLDLAVDLHIESSSGEINKTVSFSSHADKWQKKT